jgi:hypothetical protein
MAEEDAAHLAPIGSRGFVPSRVNLAALGAGAPWTAPAPRDLSGRYQMNGSGCGQIGSGKNEGYKGGPPRRA